MKKTKDFIKKHYVGCCITIIIFMFLVILIGVMSLLHKNITQLKIEDVLVDVENILKGNYDTIDESKFLFIGTCGAQNAS